LSSFPNCKKQRSFRIIIPKYPISGACIPLLLPRLYSRVRAVFKFVQPSEQLKQQVNTIINNGIKGSPCDITILASTGNKEVHCTTTGDRVLWYVYGIP
jgi:hypothetical protein